MTRQRIHSRSHLPFPVLLAVTALLLPLALEGQELPWLEGGRVRLDFAPSFWSWDTRYGIDPSGHKQEESLGSDLTSASLGSDILPDLRDLEASLGEAIGDSSYRIRLGASRALIDQSRLVFPLRMDVGVTDWLTIGAMVPFSRPRTEMLFILDTGEELTNVGLSPQTTSAGDVTYFVNTFETVLETAQEAHPGDAAVAEARTFLQALSAAYAENSFFPVVGSEASDALQGRLEEIRVALESLGVTGLPEFVPVPGTRLTSEDFASFLDGKVMRAAPLEDLTTPWKVGDVEITAAVRFLRHGFQPDSLGERPRLRYQVGAGLLLRLGTGTQASFNRLFELNPAQGQTDLEGSVFGLMEWGDRLGAWGQLRYGIQREGEITKRIAAPGEVLPAWNRAAPLLWTPGNYLDLELSPRFFLTPSMSIGVRYHHWSKGEDSYVLAPIDPEILEQLDFPPAELLNGETRETLNEIGLSVFYSTVEAHGRGEASLPLHLRATYYMPTGGSGGRTPRGGRFEAGITLLRWVWGRPQASPEHEMEG